jgi:hypothetical protein
MPYISVHDGTTHTMQPPTIPVMPQTFEMVLSQYVQHPEYKSLAPDGQPCKADSHGLLKRYPVTASELHLIGKETERGWEQADDISTLLPSLLRYEQNKGTAKSALRERLQQMSIASLEKETGLIRRSSMTLAAWWGVRSIDFLETDIASVGRKHAEARDAMISISVKD